MSYARRGWWSIGSDGGSIWRRELAYGFVVGIVLATAFFVILTALMAIGLSERIN